MKVLIQEKINIYLGKIIFDKKTSIIEKTALIHQFFHQFNDESLGEHGITFMGYSPKQIEEEIIHIYQESKEGPEKREYFKTEIDQVLTILINREVAKITKDIF